MTPAELLARGTAYVNEAIALLETEEPDIKTLVAAIRALEKAVETLRAVRL